MTQLSVQDFKEKLRRENSLLVDVRTPEELVTYGVIQENQVHINMQELGSAEKFLELPKDKILLVYCWHGTRSQLVVTFLEKHGYSNVFDLQGGIDAWH